MARGMVVHVLVLMRLRHEGSKAMANLEYLVAIPKNTKSTNTDRIL